ncbi:MAG: zinc-ribbon domain-containing protein [Oscillospiraceae bacterium]|nr:zinc ribbon domain-containing protein [Oscillospiraceae bacterium]
MDTCPNCGQALKPGAKFCTRCGAPVPAAGISAQRPRRSASAIRVW